MLRKLLSLILVLGAGLIARADVDAEDTAGDARNGQPSKVTYQCRTAGAGPWSLKDVDGAILGVDPQKPHFEIHPEIQTALICGNAVRTPDAEIQIHPQIQVRNVKKGRTPNFERLAEGGFKFWLSLSKNQRACEVVCTKN